MNVTTVLSSFVGSDNAGIDTKDFPFTVKWASKSNRSALRMAVGAEIQSRTGFVNTGSLETINQGFYAKLGHEWRQKVLRRLWIYYGIDGLGGLERESVASFNGFDNATITKTGYSVGGGPVYGINFVISPKILLSFEGSIYGTMTYEIEKEVFEFNPSFNNENSSTLYNLETNVPQWMYLVIRF